MTYIKVILTKPNITASKKKKRKEENCLYLHIALLTTLCQSMSCDRKPSI